MKYIYAALLLHEAGKEITEENLRKVLEGAGIDADETKIKALLASLEGVDIKKVLEEAKSIPVTSPAAVSDNSEKKKEEKKEEPKAEAAEGLSSLFG